MVTCLFFSSKDQIVTSKAFLRLSFHINTTCLSKIIYFLWFFLTRGNKENILRKSKRGEWVEDIIGSINGRF
jgi:hypothetical protein